MKSRIIYTDIFKDETFQNLNIDTRLFYLSLLLNEEIGQTRIYKCADRWLSVYSGLTQSQINKCKNDLEVAQLAFFRDDYICISSNIGYIESSYKGAKNEIAKLKEIDRIPVAVREYFESILDTLSIPYRYHSDTAINLNNKSKAKGNEIWELNEEGEAARK